MEINVLHRFTKLFMLHRRVTHVLSMDYSFHLVDFYCFYSFNFHLPIYFLKETSLENSIKLKAKHTSKILEIFIVNFPIKKFIA